MRADARRNRERILDATTALVLEQGDEPARDAIAARAGVGIGTLYRHFPDRQDLLHAVAGRVLDGAIEAGTAAVAAAERGADALAHYLHAAVDLGVGVLHVIHGLVDEPGWPDRRARVAAVLDDLVTSGHRDGSIQAGVTVDDVAFAVIRICRPLRVGVEPEVERTLAHRHVDLLLTGLTDPLAGGSR